MPYSMVQLSVPTGFRARVTLVLRSIFVVFVLWYWFSGIGSVVLVQWYWFSGISLVRERAAR